MVEVLATVKRWGNSLGVIIPKEVAIKEKIKPSDKVKLELGKAKTFEELCGTFKTHKTAQQLKDEEREGWS